MSDYAITNERETAEQTKHGWIVTIAFDINGKATSVTGFDQMYSLARMNAVRAMVAMSAREA